MSRRRTTPFRTLAAGLVAAVAVVPDRLGLDRRLPFVDSVSLRPQATAAALVAAAALAPARRTRATGVLVGAVGLAGVAAVAGRARRWSAPELRGDTVDLTVLSSNVLKGQADTGELATLIERVRPDIVVLPEAGHDFRDKLMPLVEAMGYRSCVSAPVGTYEVHAVTVLVHEGLGDDVQVRPARAMRLTHVEVTGGRLGSRTFYGIHATAPMQRRMIPVWRKDLRVLAKWTAAEPAPIVVGDFNATFDHSAFRAAVGRTRSAADGTGRGLVGTYPSWLPRWFGIQIDHVLVPADAITRRLDVHDLAGTDHRAVSTEVTIPRV